LASRRLRRRAIGLAAAILLVTALAVAGLMTPAARPRLGFGTLWRSAAVTRTTTPVKHLVVIFQENRSFDNYFGTYPDALNPPGEPAFTAAPDTPKVNGLSPALLTSNPNLANPFRLDRSQELTCDNRHGYTAQQKAADDLMMDRFVQSVGPTRTGCSPTFTMGYYDGNTVTALWNYAQHFAMSDANFDDTYGPSNPSIVNLISGQTHGAVPSGPTSAVQNGTLIANISPPLSLDACAGGKTTVQMTGTNIGNLLDARRVTWGWFSAGFAPTSTAASGAPVCGASHPTIAGQTSSDYLGGDDPFEYYRSTSNPEHLPPTSTAMIGSEDQANHQYDLSDFWAAAQAGDLPAVSYLRAPSYQQGHPGYSDPLEEQTFLVQTINRLERLPSWSSTAVVITWDDSDGFYDHAAPPLVNDSQARADALTGQGECGTAAPVRGYEDRCGYGPRVPLLVISPFAKVNFVSNALTAQSAILRFIEQNWRLGEIGDGSFDVMSGSILPMFEFGQPAAAPLFLDPSTGEPLPAAPS
jgi:phospholipase C